MKLGTYLTPPFVWTSSFEAIFIKANSIQFQQFFLHKMYNVVPISTAIQRSEERAIKGKGKGKGKGKARQKTEEKEDGENQDKSGTEEMSALTLEQLQDIADIEAAYNKLEETGEIDNLLPMLTLEEVEVCLQLNILIFNELKLKLENN